MIDAALRAWDGERLLVVRDAPTGSWLVIAIHSTRLGPAAGGTRMKPYPTLDAAVVDALRLSEGMTHKFATPGMPWGGAKAVIAVPPDLSLADRRGLLRRYGEVIADMGGRFLTGPDVGTGPADMDVIAETAAGYVFCRTPEAGGAGDPGPYTALGVLTGIEAVCARLFGDSSLAGRHVLVQGSGGVGAPLIELLRRRGADVSFSEVDPDLIRRFRDEEHLRFVAPDEVIGFACDVFAPCALGGVLDASTIPALRCRAVAGSANNQLATGADAARLAEQGILYAPDFVVNVGGAMAAPSIEARGWTPEQARTEVARYVRETLDEIFATAEGGMTTDEAAHRLARHNLAAGPGAGESVAGW